MCLTLSKDWKRNTERRKRCQSLTAYKVVIRKKDFSDVYTGPYFSHYHWLPRGFHHSGREERRVTSDEAKRRTVNAGFHFYTDLTTAKREAATEIDVRAFSREEIKILKVIIYPEYLVAVGQFHGNRSLVATQCYVTEVIDI